MRKEGFKLINMFLLMMSAGMPELNTEQDIEYMVKKLQFEKSEQEAAKNFRKELQERNLKCYEYVLNTWFRRWDNLAHNFK